MGGLSFSSCSKDKGENLAGRRALSWGQCEGLHRKTSSWGKVQRAEHQIQQHSEVRMELLGC